MTLVKKYVVLCCKNRRSTQFFESALSCLWQTYQVNNPTSRFSYATLIVTVEDVNDHRPVIQLSSYNVTIPENSPRNYHVLTLQAVDYDRVGSHRGWSNECVDATIDYDKVFTAALYSVLVLWAVDYNGSSCVICY